MYLYNFIFSDIVCIWIVQSLQTTKAEKTENDVSGQFWQDSPEPSDYLFFLVDPIQSLKKGFLKWEVGERRWEE